MLGPVGSTPTVCFLIHLLLFIIMVKVATKLEVLRMQTTNIASQARNALIIGMSTNYASDLLKAVVVGLG